MARIAGVDLPREKRIEVGLTYVYGIGRSTARKILADTGVDPNTKVRDLAEGEVGQIRSYVDQNVQVEGDQLSLQDGKATLLSTALYQDELVKESDGAWRFTKRHIELDLP